MPLGSNGHGHDELDETNHATERVERKEAPGETLKDVRIWRPLGPRSSAELAVDRPAPMLLASLGCGDF